MKEYPRVKLSDDARLTRHLRGQVEFVTAKPKGRFRKVLFVGAVLAAAFAFGSVLPVHAAGSMAPSVKTVIVKHPKAAARQFRREVERKQKMDQHRKQIERMERRLKQYQDRLREKSR